ncbi:hypothetical protein [Mucisphaera calidilacus]|uniref:Non-reducing end alpha-L-arabinofuranosidase n=1 Tax=Mucisphaera calidilacus TaxID=2527982 RepID=A0A518BU82_9BACT|nr:hypothetical protein [Mucisphaera calidilacus]QDU70516.1 hypothetical protein Pan265_03440 [Mucisphaera calidilacus]
MPTRSIHVLLIVLGLFALSGCTSQSAVENEIDVEIGTGAPMNPGVFAANNTVCTPANLPASESFRELVKALGVTAMRYPGGSTASFFDWETAHFIPEPEITRIWRRETNWVVQNLTEPVSRMPVGTLSPMNFANFTLATGMTAQWVPNVTTRADKVVGMFEHLKQNGVDVKYVEMDNEAYFWSNEFGIDAASGRRYADRVAEIAPQIRELYPDVQIGMVTREDDLFVAHHSKEKEKTGDARFEHWNEHVLADRMLEHFDAIILHHYVMQRSRLDPYDNDTDRAAAFLAFPQVTLERGAGLIHERYGDIPMWITEYNVIAYHTPRAGNSPSDQWMNATKYSAWSALYQASYWLTGLSRPDAIGILNHHSINNIDIGWGLGINISTEEVDLTSSGQLFAHLAHLAKAHDTMHPLHFENGPELGIAIEDIETVPALYGAAMQSEAKQTLVIMNRGSQNLTVEIDAESKTADVTTYRAEQQVEKSVRVQINHPERAFWEQGPMTPERNTLKAGFMQDDLNVDLPAWSLTIIEIDR